MGRGKKELSVVKMAGNGFHFFEASDIYNREIDQLFMGRGKK